MSRVCSIHEEYCPDGKCRWCEPVPEATTDYQYQVGSPTDVVWKRDIAPVPFPLPMTITGATNIWDILAAEMQRRDASAKHALACMFSDGTWPPRGE